MKRPALLPGLILTGLGLYFFMQQLDIPYFNNFFAWPMILIVIGFAFIISSFSGWDKSLMLPGGILLALGTHFQMLQLPTPWSSHWSMYPGAVGVGFLLTYLRTRHTSYLIPALVLLAIPTVTLSLGGISYVLSWWPLALVAVGLYMIFGQIKK